METILDKACANTGFEICEFGPDNDSCEKCNRSHVQLYFQGPADAGKYYCENCILLEYFTNLGFEVEFISLKEITEELMKRSN